MAMLYICVVSIGVVDLRNMQKYVDYLFMKTLWQARGFSKQKSDQKGKFRGAGRGPRRHQDGDRGCCTGFAQAEIRGSTDAEDRLVADRRIAALEMSHEGIRHECQFIGLAGDFSVLKDKGDCRRRIRKLRKQAGQQGNTAGGLGNNRIPLPETVQV